MKLFRSILKDFPALCRFLLQLPVFWGRPAERNIAGIVLFPYDSNRLHCGLAGIIAFHFPGGEKTPGVDLAPLQTGASAISRQSLKTCLDENRSVNDWHLGGSENISALLGVVGALKRIDPFTGLFFRKDIREALAGVVRIIEQAIPAETESLAECMGYLDAPLVELVAGRIEALKDMHWRLRHELLNNLEKVEALAGRGLPRFSRAALAVYKHINTVLNSIDRLEVRGRDSAGISLLLVYTEEVFQAIQSALQADGLTESWQKRSAQTLLINNSIRSRRRRNAAGQPVVAVAFTYKIASEIGRLGDNVDFLRSQIREDDILHRFLALPQLHVSVASHTRWASVGEITEPNCHPLDNAATDASPDTGMIFVCLNGDIDNYRNLKQSMASRGVEIPAEITTDTKIIPLRIGHYLDLGAGVEEAFRLAVNDFDGSHAIAMHTDLAPGKMFLAQKGSGQAIFVGLGSDSYLPTSEVYGFVEETSAYVKMDGEKIVNGPRGKTQGQIFILDQAASGGVAGINAMSYDGTAIPLGPDDVRRTEITSRDIDRQGFPHYFLKEISESPVSMEKTLLNRWKYDRQNPERLTVHLDSSAVPDSVRHAIRDRVIRRIFFIGQGTAGIAAKACADIAEHYANDPGLHIRSFKASEFSGFKIGEDNHTAPMSDTLIVAISQSGTTTDTNRTVDMVRERGAYTLAIVNRRDSDLTFKVDGVIYTSSGRDIEMSVASTKAFYSQIAAGALLSLYVAELLGRRGAEFISAEIQHLLALPGHMRDVLRRLRDPIRVSAERHAVSRTYWAAVGSGPNKASADEIRIKLSELCYKTISSDFIEDKKHIDLSSEPLIIVCAAGAPPRVIGDIVKDTAIFKAHKAIPIVIADEGEHRFDPYGADIFHVPRVVEHLAPVLNTLVGHIWGYHAALAINESSAFLHRFRLEIREMIDAFIAQGMDLYDIVLEKRLREKVASFYAEFRGRESRKQFPSILGIDLASDLTLLLKYLAGRLPVSDFEIDFGIKGTPRNILDRLFACLGESINTLARPIDAIKHQAKTVTVGTSRIGETLDGLLFDQIKRHGFSPSQLINKNVLVLKNLQRIVAAIKGVTLYRIGGLNLLGEPTDESTIEVVIKEGSLAAVPSRVETDKNLKGTKKTIVQQGNVYIGRGRKDKRSILVVPLISSDPALTNRIEHLLLLNIGFGATVSLTDKIKALGGKYEHIVNIVQENSIPWNDDFLEKVEISDLFGNSAEKIAEFVVASESRSKA